MVCTGIVSRPLTEIVKVNFLCIDGDTLAWRPTFYDIGHILNENVGNNGDFELKEFVFYGLRGIGTHAHFTANKIRLQNSQSSVFFSLRCHWVQLCSF